MKQGIVEQAKGQHKIDFESYKLNEKNLSIKYYISQKKLLNITIVKKAYKKYRQ